ncbi:YihY/virulence factor BrkB family protein [Blastococcus sp. VKM Ac-2987]|uniref:YihY/virulence factor BrkB family protein n=1 Tax=Blastococcus sp. VKM Ac-2987 TaxID=3004141 RepID=UPI0022ABB32E|nr:YhjD/YihY/BrkB family envelope integrity protein [Blastococcus sp. VKM Ac-2987]MCZ2861097.1 YihY/virulence factor BrkB family protein [Blastococcus sp. VKM Ac-2987]
MREHPAPRTPEQRTDRPGAGPGGPLSAARQRVRHIRRRVGEGYRRLPSPVRRFAEWLRSPEFLTTSSSLAFYALVSLPPMVLLGFWVAGLAVDESALQDLGTEVGDQAPEQLPVADILRGLIDVAAQTGPVAALAAIWPATTYGAALARAFSTIAPQSERRMRGMKGRLLALVIIAVLPLAVFSGLAALYLVPRLLGPGLALRLALGAGALLLVGLIIALIYGLFGLWETRWHDVAIGAATAVGLVALTTGGYLVYLEYADFTDRYGPTALATAVLLGLWLLLGNAALLAGYRVMSRRARHRARAARADGPQRPGRSAPPTPPARPAVPAG